MAFTRSSNANVLHAGRARVRLRIAGHAALLESVFVQLEAGADIPSVRFVELRGVDVVSGQVVRA